jgi:hypothetical protein
MKEFERKHYEMKWKSLCDRFRNRFAFILNHSAIDLRLLHSRLCYQFSVFAIVARYRTIAAIAQSIRNRSQFVAQSVSNRCKIAAQSLQNCCEIAAKSMRNRCVINAL